MVTMRRIIVSSMAVLLIANGCARSQGSRHAPHDGVLNIAQIQEPRSLNPLFLDGYNSGEINGLLFSYLTTYDTKGGTIPQLATEVPTLANGGISHDGTTITFHLRKDVKWQDGAPFTSRDVVFSFHAIMNPKNDTLSRYGYDQIASVDAPNAYTVVVHAKRRFAAIISYFFGGDSNYPLLPAHLLERYASLNHVPFNTAPVGTGPYRLESWQHGDRLVFVANDDYFAGKPGVRKIVVHIVPDAGTINAQLEAGELDAVFFADVMHISSLSNLPDHHVVQTPTTQFGTIQFNTQDAIVGRLAVRRAFAMAIDNVTMDRNIFHGYYPPHTGLQGLFTWAYDPKAGYVPYDPAAARALLESNGWKLGRNGIRSKNGTPLHVSLILPAGSAAWSSIGDEVVEYERAIGIDVSLLTRTSFVMTAPNGPIYQGNFQATFFTEQSSADPDATWLFACDQRAPGGFNFTRYCNRAVDRDFAAASSTFDRAKRAPYYAQIQRALIRDVPMDFIFQVKEIDIIPNALGGYTPSMYTSPYQFAWKWTLQ